LIKKIKPKIEFDFYAPDGAGFKNGAAFSSPLKESRVKIFNP
jgi:hypothetical protein